MSEPGDGVEITGLSHLVVGVDDLDGAASFYTDILGFEPLSDEAGNEAPSMGLRCADGQRLVLTAVAERLDLGGTGVHQAYGVGAAERKRISERLDNAGIEIFTYHEDRPAERDSNFYVFDPAGNRIQIVTRDDANGGPPLIDHVAVQVADMLWAEDFYTQALGLFVEHRVGWATADYARAKAWAAGEEDMAPGARRMDKRYTSMVKNAELPRVNPQVYFRAGTGGYALYLANQHYQEPPEDAAKGCPRTAFAVPRGGCDAALRALQSVGCAVDGPVAGENGITGLSVFARDPGGNFLEFAELAANRN